MVKFKKAYSIRFWHFILPSFLLVSSYMAFVAKKDVVIDDNYKGKYIKVLHYNKLDAKKSTIKYYNKPKEITVTVVKIPPSNHCVYFMLKGEITSASGEHNKIKNIKQGQTIKATEYFYPFHEFKIK